MPTGAESSPEPRPASDSDHPLTQLAHYRIVDVVGRGGMGEVYKGFDPALGRTVALKVLPVELARHDEFVRRFRAEATAVAKLSHPNIVSIFFVGEECGRPFFAMQFVDGESLAQRLARERRLSVADSLDICEQLLAGLAAAHRQGLCHRDVKPGNILIEQRSGQAFVADFGLVKDLDASFRWTATGTVMGTVDYMSPEQGRGLEVDGRADLYAVGVILYQMLSGRLPFVADSPTEVIFKHAYEPAPPLTDVAPGTQLQLAAIVHRLLSKTPSARYQTADEVLADLKSFRHNREGAREPASLEEAPRPSSGAAPITERLTAALLEPPPVEPASGPYWRRLGRWLVDRLFVESPQRKRQLNTTQLQLDRAIAEYAHRCEALEQLLEEAGELAPQLEGDARAKHEAQASLLRRRLSEMSAKRALLNSERDALLARLHFAERDGSAGVARRRFPRLRRSAVWFLSLLATVALVAVLWERRAPSTLPPAASTAIVEVTPVAAPSPGGGEDLESGPAPFAGHRGEITCLAFSPDSRLLASGGKDQMVRLWEIPGGQLVHTLKGHAAMVNSLAFAPDGDQLASCSGGNKQADNSIRLWDISSGRQIRHLAGHTDRVIDVAFSLDGARLYSCGAEYMLRMWNPQTEEEIRQISLLSSGIGPSRMHYCGKMSFSADERTVLIAARISGKDIPAAVVWSMDSGKSLFGLKDSDSSDWAEYAPDGQKAMVVARDVGLWSAKTGAKIATLTRPPDLEEPDARVREARWLWGGSHVLGLRHQGEIIIWEVATQKVVYQWVDETDRRAIASRWQGRRSSLAVSPDQRWAAVGESSGKLHLYRLPEAESFASRVGDAATAVK